MKRSGNAIAFCKSQNLAPTLAGIIALMLWSSTIAFTRSVTETMGTLNAAFFINMLSGITCYAILYMSKRPQPNHHQGKRIPYLLKAGSFFVVYMVLFNLAIGLAGNRTEVIAVGLINYLWPSLIFLFSVPILKQRVRYAMLMPGMILAFLGTVLAVVYGHGILLSGLLVWEARPMFPYLLSLAAAIAWGMYSNLTRKYMFQNDLLVLPLLFLISGGIILLFQVWSGTWPHIRLTRKESLELAYIVIFPSALAYLLWDIAMKRGNKKLVTTLSYLVPLASTLISSYYLQIRTGIYFWLACLLVITGAVLCSKSLR